jgi:hypothetical protein
VGQTIAVCGLPSTMIHPRRRQKTIACATSNNGTLHDADHYRVWITRRPSMRKFCESTMRMASL